MEFLIKYSNTESLLLPVTPAEWTLQTGQQNQSVQITKIGEINLWGPEKLGAISVQSFFPMDRTAPYVINTDAPDPLDCVALLNKWRRSGNSMRLIITDKKLKIDINIEILIESFDYGMKDGTGDINYVLTIKQYKKVSLKPVSTVSTPVLQRNASSKKNSSGAQTTYTVKSGDTLLDLAKKYYGNGSQYMKIFNANKNKLSDPNTIKVGQVLIIPA